MNLILSFLFTFPERILSISLTSLGLLLKYTVSYFSLFQIPVAHFAQNRTIRYQF